VALSVNALMAEVKVSDSTTASSEISACIEGMKASECRRSPLRTEQRSMKAHYLSSSGNRIGDIVRFELWQRVFASGDYDTAAARWSAV
jgi:hypothetical protein